MLDALIEPDGDIRTYAAGLARYGRWTPHLYAQLHAWVRKDLPPLPCLATMPMTRQIASPHLDFPGHVVTFFPRPGHAEDEMCLQQILTPTVIRSTGSTPRT